MSQSIQATTPSMMGAPDGAGRHDTPANLSVPLAANALHTLSCSLLRTFTQNDPVLRIFGKLLELLSGRKAISGGSSEADVNDPTVIAAGVPSACTAVTATTPVG